MRFAGLTILAVWGLMTGLGCAERSEPETAHLNAGVWTRETLDYLRDRGIPVAGGDGQPVIPATPESEKALLGYLRLLDARLSIVHQNIANATTVSNVAGQNRPYRRQWVIADSKGDPATVDDLSRLPVAYEPGNPLADGAGYVTESNVDVAVERVEEQQLRGEVLAAADALCRVERSLVVRLAEGSTARYITSR